MCDIKILGAVLQCMSLDLLIVKGHCDTYYILLISDVLPKHPWPF